ncbi:MAG: LacI family DNA-binding transcriptional regulator [Clostridium sp.]|jgi:LacI family transcriptional regulator|nr:LacI family DNA-binding transcriptional regulator [Clostridium sp.]
MSVKKTVSMQRIADQLGISKVTVSKALNEKEGVSDELKDKIVRTAKNLGYFLPSYGQRQSKRIGIVVNARFASGSDSGKFYMGMYERIMDELRKISYFGAMVTPDRESIVREIETIERNSMFDGMILLGILDPEVKKRMGAIKLPVIYVDVYDETGQVDSVVTENIYSTYRLGKYLAKLGHEEIGFVGTVGATTSITDRYLGYKRAVIEQGRPVRPEWILPDRTMDGQAIEIELPEELPTAFLCNCDETAFRLVRILKDRGLRVPEDVSVVGFDNDIYATLCEPQLTTVAVNVEDIGRMAARRMKRNIERTRGSDGEVYRIEGKRILRASVRDLKS